MVVQLHYCYSCPSLSYWQLSKWFDSGGLRSLDISRNQLNGKIPKSLIGRSLVHLPYLDLSVNNLEGDISKSFSTSLVHLDLSHNKLRGSVSET